MRRADAEFIERMGAFFEDEGRPRISGRIFGRLLLSPGPVSLDDLSRELHVSKASVSTDTRRLVLRGILARSTRPGDRRHYYSVADELPLRTMELRLERMRRFHDLVADARQIAGAARPVRARLAEMDEAYQKLLDIVDRALDGFTARRRRATRTRASRR
jgi:DNA-binding transcriptional regulator GbsR (MarR family)